MPTPEHWATVVPESDDVIEGVAVTAGRCWWRRPGRPFSRLDRLPLAARPATPATSTAPRPRSPCPSPARWPGGGRPRQRDGGGGLHVVGPPTELWRWSPVDGRPSTGRGALERPALARRPGGLRRRRAVPVDRRHRRHAVHRPPGRHRRADTPTLLTGYGGFAVTMSPAYSPTAVAVADDGGVFAVACIRGGAEAGEDWHRAGMREHKQQVFDDFAAAADWLVAEGRTDRDRLAIRGGSNGGLLVAATITQRPDLCRAAVCAVPLTDMVRFPRFLIARLWTPEYGDPDVADEFAWLWAYSPYHHLVEGTCYPATLVLTGEEDSRVDPAHARKFGAALAWATSCGEDRPGARAGRVPGRGTARASRRRSRPTRPPTSTPSSAGRSGWAMADDETGDVAPGRRSPACGPAATVADRAPTSRSTTTPSTGWPPTLAPTTRRCCPRRSRRATTRRWRPRSWPGTR